MALEEFTGHIFFDTRASFVLYRALDSKLQYSWDPTVENSHPTLIPFTIIAVI
jgi:hypothetical protein